MRPQPRCPGQQQRRQPPVYPGSSPPYTLASSSGSHSSCSRGSGSRSFSSSSSGSSLSSSFSSGEGTALATNTRAAAAPLLPPSAQARVEETRLIKEAQFWGREVAPKRELPAYWSVATYGQPFNDERIALGGVTNMYQILEPSAAATAAKFDTTGPATEAAALLRKSLTDGQRYFAKSDMSALAEGMPVEPLTSADRMLVLSKLTVYQRIYALRNCLDRDTHAKDFVPWTAMVEPSLNARLWHRNKELAIRIATQRLENKMRRHLRYLSDQRSSAARAPASSSKAVLKEEFRRVDPDRTELVALEQFLQVW
eukprot:353783-Chlamydomonas_euryale.AAC.14